MSAFSDLFEKGENSTPSPLYTACVSVLLYETFHECKFVPNYIPINNSCSRHGEYNVPIDFTLGNDSVEHCLNRIYWFSLYNSFEGDTGFRIKKLCDAANCVGISSPDEIKLKLACLKLEYLLEMNGLRKSRNSTSRVTPLFRDNELS